MLGRMRRAALNTVFGSNQEKIQDTLRGVVNASADAFPQLAFDSYEALWNIDGVGEGIASRLLTLARPDRFVSLNNASRGGVAGIEPTNKGLADHRSNHCKSLLPRELMSRVFHVGPSSGPTTRAGAILRGFM